MRPSRSVHAPLPLNATRTTGLWAAAEPDLLCADDPRVWRAVGAGHSADRYGVAACTKNPFLCSHTEVGDTPGPFPSHIKASKEDGFAGTLGCP
ncbi:unnamed protein product [Arctogadus glacialis]